MIELSRSESLCASGTVRQAPRRAWRARLLHGSPREEDIPEMPGSAALAAAVAGAGPSSTPQPAADALCVPHASAKLASASLRPLSIPHRWSEARGSRRPHAAADTSFAPPFPCQPRPPQAAGKNSNRALREIPPRLQPCTLRPPEHTATPAPASTTGKARQQSWRRTSRRETCEVTACALWLAGEHRVGRRWTPLNVAAAQGLRPSPRVPRPRRLPRLCAGSPPCARRIAGRLCPSSTSSQT